MSVFLCTLLRFMRFSKEYHRPKKTQKCIEQIKPSHPEKADMKIRKEMICKLKKLLLYSYANKEIKDTDENVKFKIEFDLLPLKNQSKTFLNC